MLHRFGDMWSVFDEADQFLVTTNSYVRHDGCAVLGRGIAAEAKRRIRGVEALLGAYIRESCGHLGRYGLALGPKIGAFQVKYHFKDAADIELIEYSTMLLTAHAHANPDKQIHLNFPGIGNGRLSVHQVLPVIEKLPDNVSVWRFEE